ncbi:MAG: hypothetical protein JST92_26290, partial [Deltaproteobacteria bacterium]|nr:hypothetical protein [Deltaproteobacteria bacterium]
MSTNKVGAPVVGFNHNVKHQGRVFHVQTEDSGLPHAHYITHLFVGGNIVNSMKSSYADQTGASDLSAVVRKLMETQHKQMLKRLVAGEFNALIERFSAPHYEPGVMAGGQKVESIVNVEATAPASAGSMVSAPPAPHVHTPGPVAKPPPSPPAAAKPAPAPVAAAKAPPP